MKKNKYKVILTMVGNNYESEGETIDEALAGLALDWHNIKAKGVIKVSCGNRSTEKLFYLNQLKRIFANKITRLMWARRLDLFLRETANEN